MEIIAERQLDLAGGDPPRTVVVRVYKPEFRDSEWCCDYELIGFPGLDDRSLRTMSGEDAMHALLGALFILGTMLRAHGGITWKGGDLGFPSSPSSWANDKLCEVCGTPVAERRRE